MTPEQGGSRQSQPPERPAKKPSGPEIMRCRWIMTACGKRSKTETEQGWLQRMLNEAEEQTEDAGERWVARVAQATAPTGAHRRRQENGANDAVKDFENKGSELRVMQFLCRHTKIVHSGSASMMPQQPGAYQSTRDARLLDVADMHAYVVAVDWTRDAVFVADPLRLQPLVDVATQFTTMDEEVHKFQEIWPASVGQCGGSSYLAGARTTWFL